MYGPLQVYVKESNLDQEEEQQEQQQEQHVSEQEQHVSQQQHHHPASSKSDLLTKNHQVDSVIQVLRSDHVTATHHQSSVVTSVAAASARPVINLVDSQNGRI